MGLSDDPNFRLIETRVERLPSQLRLTHVFEYRPLGIRLQTEPFAGYD
jgi:hypothetical protein